MDFIQDMLLTSSVTLRLVTAYVALPHEALLAAGRTHWYPGERVRFYRTRGKVYTWLPDENEEVFVDRAWGAKATMQEQEQNTSDKLPSFSDQKTSSLHPTAIADRRDYDIEHYIQVLITSYAARLRKAFSLTISNNSSVSRVNQGYSINPLKISNHVGSDASESHLRLHQMAKPPAILLRVVGMTFVVGAATPLQQKTT